MEDRTAAAYVAAVLGPIAVAASLVSVRGELDATNVALALVLVVVAVAAVGGRGPAVAAAVTSAASFEFFFTKPYLSLRIHSGDDVATTLILMAIGLLVGQIVTWARRQRAAAARGSDELARLRRVAQRASRGGSVEVLERVVVEELQGLLSLHECRLESHPPADLPVLERSGSVTGERVRHLAGDHFALPTPAVDLPVVGDGRVLTHLVLEGDPAVGVSIEERLVAIALADQLGAALGTRLRPLG
jgi:hypothetical protein